AAQPLAGHLQGEPRLACASGAGQREQAAAVELPAQLAELALASDEARELDRQVVLRPPVRLGGAAAGARRPRLRRRLRRRHRSEAPGEDVLVQATSLRVGVGLVLAA